MKYLLLSLLIPLSATAAPSMEDQAIAGCSSKATAYFANLEKIEKVQLSAHGLPDVEDGRWDYSYNVVFQRQGSCKLGLDYILTLEFDSRANRCNLLTLETTDLICD